MTTVYTTSLNLPEQGTGDNPNAWGTVLNAGLVTLDNTFGATTTVALTNVNVTLTQTQCACKRFLLTGVLSGNVVITIPLNVALAGVQGQWIVDNTTTGAYTVTFSSAGAGTSVVCNQGVRTSIYCDGTNVISAFTDGTTALIGPVTALASASTVNIGAAATNYVTISGVTTITAFDTVAAGIARWVRFIGAMTLTYNGTTLILPTAANIQTAVGDVALFVSEGSGNWRCVNYTLANGTPLSTVGTMASLASATTTDLGSTGVMAVLVTGTTTITGFGSSATTADPLYWVKFNGALTLTYNVTSLVLPGAANITTAANDFALMQYLGSGNWICLNYYRTASVPPSFGGSVSTTGTFSTGGNFSTANAFATSGAFSITLTATGATSVTLPTSGTLLNNALTSAYVFVGSAGAVATGVAISGDATIANTGALTVTKTSGVAFGTAAVGNTGTSGATIPLLNGNNTQSGTQAFSSTVTFSGAIICTVTVVTSGASYSVLSTDNNISVNKTVGSATAINLPAGVSGRKIIITDDKGDAATNNITLTPSAGTIEGNSTFIMSKAGESRTVVYNGTEWRIINYDPQINQTKARSGNYNVNAVTDNAALQVCSASLTATLPAANTTKVGYSVGFFLTGAASTVTVSPTGADNINGANSNVSLTTQYSAKWLISDGSSNWYVSSSANIASTASMSGVGDYRFIQAWCLQADPNSDVGY